MYILYCMIPHNHFLSDQNIESIIKTLTKDNKTETRPQYNAGTIIEEKPAFYRMEDQSSLYSTRGEHEMYKYILDPFSVIVKLAIFSKKEEGCKFSIMNNVLYIQEPGFFQPLVRYLFNNTKEELSYLYNPIETACFYFINRENKNIENKNIEKIFIMAQKGINQLIKQYREHNMIVHMLYMYYNVIMNYLGDYFNDTLFIKDNLTEIYEKEFVEQLNESWTDEKIKIVLDMLEFIDRDEHTKKSVKCLEEFMVEIDKETIHYFSLLEKEYKKE